jgi:hypothetical protein
MHNYALSKCQMDCQLCYYFLFCVIIDAILFYLVSKTKVCFFVAHITMIVNYITHMSST